MISTRDIETALRDVSPDLTDWNPTDTHYDILKWGEISELIDQFPADHWIENKWECEEIAKSFMMSVRRLEAADPSRLYNRAIGVANCTRLQGEDLSHTVNILITDQGVALLDMQTKAFWLANNGEDTFFFVEM